jgi:hypothetical protein
MLPNPPGKRSRVNDTAAVERLPGRGGPATSLAQNTFIWAEMPPGDAGHDHTRPLADVFAGHSQTFSEEDREGEDGEAAGPPRNSTRIRHASSWPTTAVSRSPMTSAVGRSQSRRGPCPGPGRAHPGMESRPPSHPLDPHCGPQRLLARAQFVALLLLDAHVRPAQARRRPQTNRPPPAMSPTPHRFSQLPAGSCAIGIGCAPPALMNTFRKPMKAVTVTWAQRARQFFGS